MRDHVFTTFGLIMFGIFLWRAIDAFSTPGFGLMEVYVLGGFALSIALVVSGVRGLLAKRRAARSASPPDQPDA